ncbi:MAG TPA: hypothetical protein VLI05_01925 [Candidatus Saccharimonadia bacterium]|nr:hypothetical protein [Candidatus Saccharimonadia bacterium]
MADRLVVALDYDDTLSQTSLAKVRWAHNAQFNLAAYPSPLLEQLWTAAAPEAAFYADPRAGLAHCEVVEGALAAVQQLARVAKIVVITAGYDEHYVPKQVWLARHFPGLIHEMVFLKPGETKAEHCRRLGVSVIIEDRYDYAAGCAQAGIEAILVKRYSWSNGPALPHLQIVDDWPAATRKALELLEEPLVAPA